ncbi:CoA transferase [Sphingobium sp. JS3065]|uniref:CaiB/BaiF CoA transferase family protein n=1 Tax=Sphingobium sp. JS3065 TaxID=2970925 RepID=UPI0022650F6B|nr:CoA transferase [Sphingobium sp. JS3065]UZW56390.1 CoA transferase [Sphingobium sp. JS3065]
MNGGVLQGIKVVDLTSVVVGPVATMFLADYGADVIKVEAPAGDLLRKLGGASRSGQLSPKFLHFNRNKRSIAIDLKSAEGMAALRKLIASADICVSNMRGAAMKRLGLDVDSLFAMNPRLIYCSLVGFGQKGRYAAKPAYDGIIQGVGGLTGIFEAADGKPRFVPMTMADHVVGLIAAKMMLLQIIQREKTGQGGAIEVPMFENMAAFVMSEHMGQLTFDPPRGPPGDQRVLDPGARPIATSDGHICISANTDAQAFAFFRAIGRPELCEDPRFCSVKARYDNVSEYFALREDALRTRTTAEWLEIFDCADVPAGQSHTLETLLTDEHLQDVGLFRVTNHPAEGDILNIRLPNDADDLARPGYSPPPLQGQHSGDILAELGYSDEEIERLRLANVIVAPGRPQDEEKRMPA